MPAKTLREQFVEILLSTEGWVPRQRLVKATGFKKGYSNLIGPADGIGSPGSFKSLGYVEVKKEENRVSYRLTPKGRIFFDNGTETVTNWQKTLRAIHALGGRSTRREIRVWLNQNFPGYNDENLRMDLDMLSVNVASRKAHIRNPTPQDPRNALVKISGKGEEALYALYDPVTHGEFSFNENQLNPHDSENPAEKAVSLVDKLDLPEFNPLDIKTAKEYVARSVAIRRGQSDFRKSMLDHYKNECCISRCKVVQILEAAHIVPFDGEDTHHITNGLLLRADLHTLFDLGLLRIEPTDLKVELHPLVLKDTAYSDFQGRELKRVFPKPSTEAINHHRERHLARWMES